MDHCALWCMASLAVLQLSSCTASPQVISQAVALGGLLWGLKVCLTYLDPYREQREQVMQGAGAQRGGDCRKNMGIDLGLTQHAITRRPRSAPRSSSATWACLWSSMSLSRCVP